MIYDVIIIGAGPSGMTAALYLIRQGKEVLLIEKESIGGQMGKSPYIENYPSFTGSGADLADKMFAQLENKPHFHFEFADAYEVEQTNPKTVNTDSGSFKGKDVIFAGGVKPKRLPCLQNDMKHVHYCATCDGPLYAGKDVVVTGDGNSAVQYALELSNYCNSVTMVIMFDKFFAEETLVDRLKAQKNVKIISNNYITNVAASDNQLELSLSAHDSIITDGLFIAIGLEPCPIAGIVRNKYGYVPVNEQFKTYYDHVYAIGDCIDKNIRQVATAVGDGASVAVYIGKR